MSDLIQRLRFGSIDDDLKAAANEAADALEAQAAELAALKAGDPACLRYEPRMERFHYRADMARAALGGWVKHSDHLAAIAREREDVERWPGLAAALAAIERDDALAGIAEIAHNGGLAGLDEHLTLVAIRRLTLAYWNKTGTEAESRARTLAALQQEQPE